jgi:hypothetical protein
LPRSAQLGLNVLFDFAHGADDAEQLRLDFGDPLLVNRCGVGSREMDVARSCCALSREPLFLLTGLASPLGDTILPRRLVTVIDLNIERDPLMQFVGLRCIAALKQAEAFAQEAIAFLAAVFAHGVTT